jgi:hypothetical protein
VVEEVTLGCIAIIIVVIAIAKVEATKVVTKAIAI